MEPDDLLCSRNARSKTPLVGRAQWKINQAPSLGENERAWRDHLYCSMRAVKGRLGHSPRERVKEAGGGEVVVIQGGCGQSCVLNEN